MFLVLLASFSGQALGISDPSLGWRLLESLGPKVESKHHPCQEGLS